MDQASNSRWLMDKKTGTALLCLCGEKIKEACAPYGRGLSQIKKKHQQQYAHPSLLSQRATGRWGDGGRIMMNNSIHQPQHHFQKALQSFLLFWAVCREDHVCAQTPEKAGAISINFQGGSLASPQNWSIPGDKRIKFFIAGRGWGWSSDGRIFRRKLPSKWDSCISDVLFMVIFTSRSHFSNLRRNPQRHDRTVISD